MLARASPAEQPMRKREKRRLCRSLSPSKRPAPLSVILQISGNASASMSFQSIKTARSRVSSNQAVRSAILPTTSCERKRKLKRAAVHEKRFVAEEKTFLRRDVRDIDRRARRERVDRAGDTGGARHSARYTAKYPDGRTTCLLLCERLRPWWRPRRRTFATCLSRVCAFRRARSAQPAVPAPGGTRRTRAPARRAGAARTRKPPR